MLKALAGSTMAVLPATMMPPREVLTAAETATGAGAVTTCESTCVVSAVFSGRTRLPGFSAASGTGTSAGAACAPGGGTGGITTLPRPTLPSACCAAGAIVVEPAMVDPLGEEEDEEPPPEDAGVGVAVGVTVATAVGLKVGTVVGVAVVPDALWTVRMTLL